MSVDFSGTANYIAFDDITLGSSTPGSSTPEPGAFSLVGLGLASLVAISLKLPKRSVVRQSSGRR
jgi:hypothetical protein